MTFAAPDLTDSHRLLEAIESLHNQPDVGALLSAVAEYGTAIIPADGIAIFTRAAGGWRAAVARAIYDESDVVCVEPAIELLAAEGWFQHVNRVDDLSQDRRWGPAPSSQQRANLAVASHRCLGASKPCRYASHTRRGGPAERALS
jgi:hypothetical protein